MRHAGRPPHLKLSKDPSHFKAWTDWRRAGAFFPGPLFFSQPMKRLEDESRNSQTLNGPSARQAFNQILVTVRILPYISTQPRTSLSKTSLYLQSHDHASLACRCRRRPASVLSAEVACVTRQCMPSACAANGALRSSPHQLTKPSSEIPSPKAQNFFPFAASAAANSSSVG